MLVQNHHVEWGLKGFIVLPLAPNNCVCYVQGGCRRYAIVKQIYMSDAPFGKVEWAVLVSPIRDRFGKFLTVPSKNFGWMLYLLQVVVGEIGGDQDLFFLSIDDITSVAAY
ncbi:hypothetical protein CROQUDRAFT_43582 [Cronartium quercuum f. sp. fusiforme G11]|uniref:Uncharacterized protein n=1 Tax=Cronartium quercuum f. sp. fusiforme G11 TaxID=708437 RepID=A0A9P6TC66_9BASI|nr:hypothetical protein CROQUDRAFT_43582 [Cronartium quercuum f. sp. fusiforme G11]